MTTPDVSVVITVDNRTSLAHRSIASARRARDYAAARGVQAELVVVVNNPDDRTREYFQECRKGLAQCEVYAGDVAEARNMGVGLSKGKLVAFLHTGHLFGETWLQNACEALARSTGHCVWHPMFTHEFENTCKITRYKNSSDPDCNVRALLEYDLWTDVMLAPREFFERHPFQFCPPLSGFGHEMRRWYCEVIADGVPVRIVDRTSAFIRAERGAGQANGERLAMRANALFDAGSLPLCIPEYPQIVAMPKRACRPPLTARLKSFAVRQARRLKTRSPRLGKIIGGLRLCEQGLREIQAALWSPGPQGPREPLPGWFIDQWKGVHAIEPQLFPDPLILERTALHQAPVLRIVGPYSDLCQRFGRPATHVFLVPWLVRGGADLVVLNYVRAVCELGDPGDVVVIAGENVDSPWAARLPPGVRFIEFGKQYSHLDADAQTELLVRLLLQQAPKVIHNINSRLGYDAYIKYGRALRQSSRLYADAYCDNISPEGKLTGYIFHDLPKCFEHLTMVFSDNRRILEDLHRVFALDLKKMRVHYQPMYVAPSASRARSPAALGVLNVLWAGRLDRQKRPDILAAVADRCRQYPFHFHVHGCTLLEPAAESLKDVANVTCYGTYASFDEIHPQNFDVLLHTAQWDGVPNTLLEGMAAGLPAVASDVGGIGEVITPGKTGFLTSPFDDVEQYVQALVAIHENKVDLDGLVANGFELLRRRHSWQAFLQNLSRAPGYLCNGEASLGEPQSSAPPAIRAAA